MEKTTVIAKAFYEKYWDNYIEKAMSHKYIRKIPNSKGGYYYIYPKDFAKPMKVLLSVFGLKEEKIDDAYAKQNIQADYGATKKDFAAHVLEYLSNRGTWNKFFNDKFNRDRYKDPIKFEPKKSELKTKVESGEIKNNGKTTDKTGKEHNETTEKDFKSKWNNSLMRKIYSMYNSVPEDKKVEKVAGPVAFNVGDSISHNGKTGKITKDYGNGMYFVKFDNGGMGRINAVELQNLNPSNQEVANEADANAEDQKGNNVVSDNPVEKITNIVSIEKPGFSNIERGAITLLYEKYKEQIKAEHPEYSSEVLDLKIGSKIIEEYPELDAHGEVRRTMMNVRGLAFNQKLLPDVVKFIREKNVKGNNPLSENKPVEEKTKEQKEKEWHDKWDVRLANEFVKGKEKYLNAKPLVSTSAMIIFDKIWNQIKDKTKNEQIKWLYNGVKDFYQLNHTDIEKYRKQGLSDEEIRFGYINAFLEMKNQAEEHANRSAAMMGNQNARKYGNLSDEANQIIENNNLNVNADGVVQPTETELKTSKEFFDKNRNQNYKFGKDQYGNNYIQMPGIDGYYYDENGNRVNNAAMIHKRTYHDEYIPEEPNFMTSNSDGERIYLTPEMKAVMESGDTEYHPVDSTYTKPESDSFIDDYIDTLTKEKDISALNNRKVAMKNIYEMGKDKGIHVIPVSGIMSNSGPVTNAILPLGESNPMSDNSILIDKSNKQLIDFANHVIETVEPENTPKGQNIQLSAPEKNVLSLAYEFEKRQDPTMTDLWYIEKVKARLPELAAKVDNWGEIKNINFGNTMFKDADAVQEIKDYVSDLAEKENAAETKNGALDNYASGNGMWVNNYLRNPKQFESENGKLTDDDKQYIADLDNATKSEVIPQKKLYRSVDASAIFDNISDLDYENLKGSLVYGNKEKLYADKVDSLINGALNKEITEKGFMSTTKDKEIADSWNGFTGSNKEVVLELNIPDGMTGKDMSAYEVEGDEQKEVLLPRDVDYKVKEIVADNGKIKVIADVLGVHGNHIAMLGNQNARKDGLTQDEADALEYYIQDAGYTYINDKLRGVDDTPMEEHHIDAIKEIDNVIARNTVKEKTLYRGVGGNTVFPTMNPYEHRLMEMYLTNKTDFDSMKNDDWFDGPEKYVGAKDNVEKYLKDIVGKTFNDKGYMSTSKDIEQTKTFSDSYKNGITIEFQNIPENTHGIDLSEFDGGRELRAEKEVLLQRDLNYKITGVKSIDGKIVLTAEIIPYSEKDTEIINSKTERAEIYDLAAKNNVEKYKGMSKEDLQKHNKELKAEIDKLPKNSRKAVELDGERYAIMQEYNNPNALSEAMMGNDNAKGKHNVKPQTESEMKSEQKKEKENRKKAGLRNPGNNVGDRVSAIDDVADSWDPNSENYRFKDTGYIAGSRKELASMFIIERAKGGHRIDAREIDFDGLEENPRAAEKLITKSNIFGEVNWDELKANGMSGSAAFLIDRIYASAGTKPDESNANARKQYVIALNGLRDRFEECKTVPEVIDTLQEIREEIRGEYVEIKETPEYIKIRDKMKSLRETVYNKKAELDDLAEECRKKAEMESQKVVEKYINKAKEEKLVRWNTRMSSYNIPEKYKLAYQSESSAAYKKAWEPHSKAIADFKAELISRGVPESAFVEEVRNFGEKKQIEVGWYNLYKLMPESQEYGALSSELDAYVKKMKVAVSLKNPLLEAWKSLGPRFTKILSSDSFAQHKYDCTKGKYDDWEWMQKEVKVTEKTQGKEKKKFQLLVANSITRKGGRDFNITSTADLKKAFNLREVQSGNWVLKDPASAEFHVRNAANAFADLADITGISDDKISLNGRLAMAFGARGTGGFQGAASAHYEPIERVINLTKFKGGGCLGHEWFHSFDNMITSAMTGDDSQSGVYLTNVYHGLSEVNQLLLREYIELKDKPLSYTNEYKKRQLKNQLEKKGVDISKVDGAKSTLQFRVQAAFDDLVKAMTTGTSDVKMNLHYESKDYKDMLYNFSDQMIQRYRDSDARYSGSKPHIQVAIVDAGSLEKAVDIINERYAGYTDSKSRKNKNDWLKLAAAYYDRNPSGNKHGNILRVNSGVKASQFLADAKDLDSVGAAGQKDYWATTHEMAARAFSAYLEDSLEAMGRKNDYLAYASDNKYYSDGRPYPEGEERKRINAAFKKLFEVINSEQAIQKAIDILDNFIIEKSEPRFIIKGGRFLIRK